MGWRRYELDEQAWSLREAGSEWVVAAQIRSRAGYAQSTVFVRQKLTAPGPLNRVALATDALVGFTNGLCQALWAKGYRGGFEWDRAGFVRGRFRRTIAGLHGVQSEQAGLEALFAGDSAEVTAVH
ncbi:MAG: hypothetical protein K1X89_04875 [Myxococcaceae bacterium]|nr:hypothetical protein [Myxococcaceae bacterium]